MPYLPEGSDRTESPETATLASFESGDPAASAGPVFLPSEVLADRFRVVRLLGRGGMGEVYEVEDLELGERVAVKTLRSGLAVGERALALFRSEIQLARRVTHPNVCRIFDVFRHQRTAAGEQESVVFLTMELLAGETLSASLRRDGPLPLDEALPILRQVAAGLDAAHDAGVTHRDFKSGNVMLVAGDNGPRAVVTDFGLAGAEGVAGSRSPVFGTAPYRAPEQERGAAVGPAADLYAFGRVMREVLTGAAVGVERELPAAATQAVDQCLAERPEARPSRATSAVDAIAVALAQESRTPWLGLKCRTGSASLSTKGQRSRSAPVPWATTGDWRKISSSSSFTQPWTVQVPSSARSATRTSPDSSASSSASPARRSVPVSPVIGQPPRARGARAPCRGNRRWRARTRPSTGARGRCARPGCCPVRTGAAFPSG